MTSDQLLSYYKLLKINLINYYSNVLNCIFKVISLLFKDFYYNKHLLITDEVVFLS